MPEHPDLADRADMVLTVVDIQERLAATMPEREQVLARVTQLIRTSALLGVPVIETRQYPRGLGDTEPPIEAALHGAKASGVSVVRVDKVAFCACGEPSFLEALEATGRRQVIIVGMETHICVVQTALALLARRYRVQVVDDACCSRDPRMHGTAVARLRAAGAVVTSTESVMYEAAAVAGTEEFRALLEIVKQGPQ